MSEFSTIREFSFSVEDLLIDTSLVEQTFENKRNGSELSGPSVTSEVFESIKGKVVLNAGYIAFNRPAFDKRPFGVNLNGVSFVVGNSVYQNIRNSSQVIIFFCTAGSRVVEIYNRLMEGGDWVRAYILDALGTLIVEAALDKMHEMIRVNASKHRWKVTNRYSPGYCSWDSSEKGKFFSIIPKGFCKVKWNGADTLDSMKSVIGIIGTGKDVEYIPYNCYNCTTLNCMMRKNEPLKNLRIRS